MATAPAVQQAAAEIAEGWVADRIVPTAAVVVTDAAGAILGEAYAGDADASTLFAYASAGKPITAAVAHVLHRRGDLDLDEPVVGVISEFGSGDARRDTITFRDLLAHAGGLPESSPRAPGEATRAEVAAEAARVPLHYPPRTRRCYSNPGYALVGDACERVSGAAWPDLAAALVLEPLGLDTTWFSPPEAVWDRIARVRAPGSVAPGVQMFNSSYYRAAGLPQGGAYGTARDLARLASAFLPAAHEVLGADVRDALTLPHLDGLPGGIPSVWEWEDAPWGQGFEVRGTKTPYWGGEQASARTYTHTGWSGTLTAADPERGTAWAVIGTRGVGAGWTMPEALPQASDRILAGLDGS